jgi:hypothetical protein
MLKKLRLKRSFWCGYILFLTYGFFSLDLSIQIL